MRVLILNYEYPPLGGGAANALFHIVREFGASGFPEIDVVTSAADGIMAKEKPAANVTIHKLPVQKDQIHYWTQREIIDYSRRANKYIKQLLDQQEYSLTHAFFALPCGYIARRYRRRLPYIVSLRGSDVPGFNRRLATMEPVLKPIFKRVLRDAAAVQANSSGLRDLAIRTSRSAEIEIIYNGVDCEQFQPAVRPGPQQPIHLISVCRLIERKGVGDLIEALPLIKEALGGVKLTVVGEGDLEAELKEQAGRLGLAGEIDWLGFVEHDRLPELYQQADIFVLPSHYEGMSNSLLEAMAAGLAVVVTDTGGTRELFRENGMIVAPGQPKSIADAIIKLGRDSRGLLVSAARSRETAETFSWAEVARQYLEVYERVVGKTKGIEDGRRKR